MKIVVDYDRCESNAVCMGILPEVFEVRDDNFMYVLNETPPESMRAKVLQCVNGCPTGALSIEEEGAKPAAGGGSKTTAAAAEGSPPASGGTTKA